MFVEEIHCCAKTMTNYSDVLQFGPERMYGSLIQTSLHHTNAFTDGTIRSGFAVLNLNRGISFNLRDTIYRT